MICQFLNHGWSTLLTVFNSDRDNCALAILNKHIHQYFLMHPFKAKCTMSCIPQVVERKPALLLLSLDRLIFVPQFNTPDLHQYEKQTIFDISVKNFPNFALEASVEFVSRHTISYRIIAQLRGSITSMKGKQWIPMRLQSLNLYGSMKIAEIFEHQEIPSSLTQLVYETSLVFTTKDWNDIPSSFTHVDIRASVIESHDEVSDSFIENLSLNFINVSSRLMNPISLPSSVLYLTSNNFHVRSFPPNLKTMSIGVLSIPDSTIIFPCFLQSISIHHMNVDTSSRIDLFIGYLKELQVLRISKQQSIKLTELPESLHTVQLYEPNNNLDQFSQIKTLKVYRYDSKYSLPNSLVNLQITEYSSVKRLLNYNRLSLPKTLKTINDHLL